MSLDALRPALESWGALWRTPSLAQAVDVRFSARIRRSLGRCDPAKAEIRLHPALAEGPAELLREVLCHEAAHVATYVRYGKRVRPHGPEWASLVRLAGFVPRARFAPQSLPETLRRRTRPGRLYEHRCPVCGAARAARRAMRWWRCRRCREAGRDGRLEITVLLAEAGIDGPGPRR